MSSIPRCDAASISITSSAVASWMRRQISHVPSGVAVGPFSQLSAFARIFASDVLPVPRGPENRYACAMRPCSTALPSVRTM
jgi:hypothetical protein